MTDADRDWSLSNAGPQTLRVWLEPWAEEFEVPVGSTITLSFSRTADDCELSDAADHLVVWAGAGQTVQVFIDGVLQDTGSASIPVPEGGDLSPKEILTLAFGNDPSARLGGRSAGAQSRPSLWRRVKRLLGM